MSTLRWLLFGALLAALVAAGAARLATHDDASRLQADLAAAEAALRQEDSAHAVALARGVLEREPVNGHAFGVLARALADDGNDQADRLRFKAAARRAPRDPGVRAKLAAWALEAGDHATAVDHLDALLTGAPGQRQPMLQLIASMTPDRDFSAALAAHLIRYPQWRSAILRATTASKLP
ncbi:MAG TPA: hypothetical protein PLS34_08665, partial [Gammaproteobacteria bacterium]|nr:hypothetical protein [Gammaproteobacteria bacterium]